MDELIAQVTSTANIDPTQARNAVETVLGFLKERLPAPVAAQLETAITAGAVAGIEQQAEKALGGLGGVFGGGEAGKGDGSTGSGF